MPESFGPCCRREEQFKRIPGVPDYVVSNLGRVRRDTPGKGTYVGRIIKPVRRPDGHLYVYMPPGNGDKLRNTDRPRPKGLFIALQRLVVAAWLPPMPEARWKDPRQITHHKDGNKAHNCDTNLAWRSRAKHLRDHYAQRRRERDADDTDGRPPPVFRERPEIRVEPDPWG